jgi:integrase/recombinase XerD
LSKSFIQELRGDIRKDSMDIYDHIGLDELKEAYMKYVPLLGITI